MIAILGLPTLAAAQGVVSSYDPSGSAAMIAQNTATTLAVQNVLRNAFDASESSGPLATVPRRTAEPQSALGGLKSLFGGKGPSDERLTFRRSSAISDKVESMFIANIAEAHPELKDQASQAFDGDAIINEYDRLLSSYGYSGRNLADVMTGYAVISWEVVNGTDASNNASGIRSVNSQIRQSLLANPKFASASDGDKQLLAEILAYQATIAGAAKNEFVKKGQQQELAALRGSVAQSARQLGMDLQAVTLGANGFVPK